MTRQVSADLQANGLTQWQPGATPQEHGRYQCRRLKACYKWWFKRLGALSLAPRRAAVAGLQPADHRPSVFLGRCPRLPMCQAFSLKIGP